MKSSSLKRNRAPKKPTQTTETFRRTKFSSKHMTNEKKSFWNNVCSQLAAQPPSPLSASEVTRGDTAAVDKKYRYWRLRTLYSMFIGYAAFYLVRKNLSTATPGLIQDLHFTKTQIGALASGLAFSYGLSKFIMGVVGDRANPRYFMAIGLAMSAILNIFFGLSSSFYWLAILWIGNGWFQGMGWPPCARGLTQWFSSSERGTYWGIWNASHNVGGAVCLALAGWLTQVYGWRFAFYVPAVFALAVSIFLVERLRDTPQSIGLPPVEKYKDDPSPDEHFEKAAHPMKKILFEKVLRNPNIWALAIANFFVYIVRYGAMDWAPTFLVEVKGASIAGAAFKVTGYELIGMVGAFVAGLASDRLFKGRRGPVNVAYMAALIAAVAIFWLNPKGHALVDAIALMACGFLIYGPQMLVGVSAADIAGKSAAATATGFVGLVGYLGSIFAGYGIGWTLDHYGWDGGFKVLIACAVLGTICFAYTWNASPRARKS